MANLNGKIAIVTGGSGGLGSATCLRLAQDKAKVVVHYGGSEDAANKVVGKVKDNGGQGIAVQADLSDHKAVIDLFESTEQSNC